MPNIAAIATANLDAGADSPRLARQQLLEAVQAVNALVPAVTALEDAAVMPTVLWYNGGAIGLNPATGLLTTYVNSNTGGSDNRLAVFTYRGTTYTIRGTNAASATVTIPAGNAFVYLQPSDAGFDPANVSIANFKAGSAVPVGAVPLARVVWNDGITSSIIKRLSDVADLKFLASLNSGVANVLRYSNRRIQYDPAARTLTIVGDNVSGDDRVLIFDAAGKTWSVRGAAGESKYVPASGTGGNQFLVISASADNTNIRLSDMNFVAAVTSAHILIARVVWNAGVTSQIIDPAPAPSLTRRGMADLFMRERLSSERQIFKLAIYGDSIFASGFKDITFPDAAGLGRYEQPPRSANLDSLQRYIYDYLNFNKPKFRNCQHTDWTYAGTNSAVVSVSMPNDNTGGVGNATQWERYRRLSDTSTGNTAEITITGNSTAVLVFEGGAIGSGNETGTAQITVSVNGGAFVAPSTVLSGALTKKGFGSTKVFAAAPDSFATAFTSPVSLNAYNTTAPLRELVYNGLNPASTYRFRVTKPAAEARPVRLWGIYHFTGQTLLVHNEAQPGFSWLMLAGNVYGNLVLSGTDYVLLEAPMYHDLFMTDRQVQAAAQTLINSIQGYGMQVALCSCPPGSVIPAGRATAILGDENGSSYRPGQHFAKYYDRLIKLTTADLGSVAEAPAWGAVYSCVVNSVTYQLTAITTGTPLPTGYSYFQAPADFPGFTTMPTTLTKVSGTGKSTILYTSASRGLTMAQHRDSMQAFANTQGLAFVDLYQAFIDIARSVGEDLYTDGYAMDAAHPLYATLQALDTDNANYPELAAPYLMNYLSNFFDIGDGHHLANSAHQVIFEAVRNQLLRDCAFKS